MCRILTLSLLVLVGCQRRDREQKQPFQQADSGSVLLIAVDPALIDRNQNIHEFVNHSIDRFFEDRIGEPNDQIIVAGITTDRQSLIWQGTPLQIREEFETPRAFHAMISSRCKYGTQFAHDNLIRALKYVESNRSVAQGKAQSAALFLCDLPVNNTPEDQALLDAIVSYLKADGMVGFYYLSQDAFFKWDKLFKDAGYPWVDIECDVHGRPMLPDFEDMRRGFK